MLPPSSLCYGCVVCSFGIKTIIINAVKIFRLKTYFYCRMSLR